MSDIVDLDVIRPKPKYIKLGEKKIDVSFIPCGITFDIDQLMQELATITISEVQKGKEEARKAFNLTVDMCVLFCSIKYPELDRKWFMNNVDAVQIQKFADTIKTTLQESYKIVEEYGETEGKN